MASGVLPEILGAEGPSGDDEQFANWKNQPYFEWEIPLERAIFHSKLLVITRGYPSISCDFLNSFAEVVSCLLYWQRLSSLCQCACCQARIVVRFSGCVIYTCYLCLHIHYIYIYICMCVCHYMLYDMIVMQQLGIMVSKYVEI